MFTLLASYIYFVLAIDKTGSFLEIFIRTAANYRSHHAHFYILLVNLKNLIFFKDNKIYS